MTDELIGKAVNGYEVQTLIGQGGMARVYLARQQSMDRQVALKVLPQQFLSDDTYLQRFNREVLIVSQLEHRNIVPVYDYGEFHKQPYIVMRYMPSGSVDDLLAEGALKPEKVISIVSQIAPALDYAHSKGVLHRDLKPSNILMDEADGAYITDFGIARLANAKGATITTQGVVGTPSYMSPEQAQGKELDGRSDLYSLAVMLFEMMTGRRPFESETPYSIAVMQVTTPPPHPRAINPNVSLAMENVILKALRKDPNERYQTAHELLEAVKRAIETPNFVPAPTPAPVSYTPAEATPQPMPSVQNVAPPYQPNMQAPQPRYNTSQNMSYARVPQRKQTSPFVGLLLGGGIGCLGVIIVGAIAFLVFNWALPPAPESAADSTESVTDNANAFVTNTNAPFITPNATLDATSESARNLLLLRQSNDATMTAIVLSATPTPQNTPTPAIGQRESPLLTGRLAEVRGTIVFTDQRGTNPNSYDIVTLNLETGEERQLTDDGSDNSYPIASPDGRWIAFQSDRDGGFEIYIMNTLGGQVQQLTNNNYLDRVPAWSPDGEWIIYSSDVRNDGLYDLYRTKLDASVTELVYSSNERKSHARYSPDGRYIVFTTGTNANNSSTWEIARYDTQMDELTALTRNNLRDSSPLYSPDGTQILYTSLSNGSSGVALMNADGTGRQMLYNSIHSEWAATFSPDAQFIIATSLVEDEDQLYLVTADGTEGQYITLNGGSYASWIGQ